MSKSTITKEELIVPVGILIEVAGLFIDGSIDMEIIGTDSDDDTVTLEVEYDKEQRETIHEAKDCISDYEDEDDEEEDENREN